jgi:ADP-ribose pyrophosphatase
MRRLLDTPTSAGMTSEIIHLFHAGELTREHAGGGVGGEDIIVHHVPLAELRAWLCKQQDGGKLIDFKIHACLFLAGLSIF